MVAPTREFTISSLLTIGASTLVFGLALGYFVERGLLDREWASTTAFVQSAARAHLRPTDFGRAAPMATLEAGDRFEEFARQVRDASRQCLGSSCTAATTRCSGPTRSAG